MIRKPGAKTPLLVRAGAEPRRSRSRRLTFNLNQRTTHYELTTQKNPESRRGDCDRRSGCESRERQVEIGGTAIRIAEKEGPLSRRQEAREETWRTASALFRRRLLRQPALHRRQRRALRGRHQGPHQTRSRRDRERVGQRRLFDGKGFEVQRLPRQERTLCADERGLSRPVRRRAASANDDRGGMDSGRFARRD